MEQSAVQQQTRRQEIEWGDVREPGAYVEVQTGHLYRIPPEAIGPASPLVAKQALQGSRLVRLSPNAFVSTLEARMAAAEANITPAF